MIEVRQLVKRYGDLVALDHLDLSIRDGEIYGLLGPNGSGKTTAINIMLALLSYDSGEVTIMGKPMRPSSYSVKREIGAVMQNVAVFDHLTVWENIDFFCGLYVPQKKRREELVEQAIHFTGLEDFRRFLPGKLSGGLLRRLNIACGIAHEPKLIFLDEPTVAVDPQSRNRILENLLQLNRNGATIVYTTHYMEEVEQICDRIGILDEGKLIAEGSAQELKELVSNGETIRVELITFSEEALAGLDHLGFITNWQLEGSQLTVRTVRGDAQVIHLVDYFKEQQITFSALETEKPTLNTVFLELTGKELRDRV